ncbi:LysE family transporter [Actinacidiphila sp. ITFR-21]|uniref:LysE family transporter n=1 Tax=Actinacidiphila sp. ITFR-21 TaxID=3075199 RepID=UPI00288B5A56|nr:LysE family transporter [Streptomyces sp. ITFR-21]WNI16079.1 LysE family transporter [Streptomyces sp. ITFR-21]
MLGTTDLPTYLAGVALIVLLPGPNSLYVLSVAARRGPRTAYRAAAGVLCGDTVLMTLSAAGVASLLKASPIAFDLVKFAGAGYLTWLAVGMLRTARRTWRSRAAKPAAAPPSPAAASRVPAAAPAVAPAPAGDPLPRAAEPPSPAAGPGAAPARQEERPYRRALVVSLFNPKAILFFIAFFVQFVDPAYPHPALSFLLLGSCAQVLSITYLTALIFAGSYLASTFRRRTRLAATLSAGTGAVFLAFAAKLSLAGTV